MIAEKAFQYQIGAHCQIPNKEKIVPEIDIEEMKEPYESWPTPFWIPVYDAFYTSMWWKYKIPIVFQLARLVLKIIGRHNSKIPTIVGKNISWKD